MEQAAKSGGTLSGAFKKVAFHAAVIGVLGVTALYTGVDVTGAVTDFAQNSWTAVVGAPAVA